MTISITSFALSLTAALLVGAAGKMPREDLQTAAVIGVALLCAAVALLVA